MQPKDCGLSRGLRLPLDDVVEVVALGDGDNPANDGLSLSFFPSIKGLLIYLYQITK